MAVLPDRFHHHQRRVRRNAAKYLHPMLLAVNESMAFLGVARMPAADVAALPANGVHYGLFCPGLRRPTTLVGRQAQIPIGDQDYGLRHEHIFAPRTPKVYLLAVTLPREPLSGPGSPNRTKPSGNPEITNEK